MAEDNEDEAIKETRERSTLTLWWFGAAGVAVLAIMALIAVLIWGDGRAGRAAEPPPGAGSVMPTASPTPSPGTGQNIPADWKPCQQVDQAQSGVEGEQWEELDRAPATTWRVLDGQRLPTTAGGPFKYEQKDGGTLASCYTPDALGALTALAQIVLRSNTKPGGRTVRLNQTLPGTTLQLPEALESYEKDTEKPWPEVAGFEFLTPIEDNTTTIIMQAKFPPDKYTVPIAWEVTWTGTDWKVGNSVHVYGPDDEDKPDLTRWSAE